MLEGMKDPTRLEKFGNKSSIVMDYHFIMVNRMSEIARWHTESKEAQEVFYERISTLATQEAFDQSANTDFVKFNNLTRLLRLSTTLIPNLSYADLIGPSDLRMQMCYA